MFVRSCAACVFSQTAYQPAATMFVISAMPFNMKINNTICLSILHKQYILGFIIVLIIFSIYGVKQLQKSSYSRFVMIVPILVIGTGLLTTRRTVAVAKMLEFCEVFAPANHKVTILRSQSNYSPHDQLHYNFSNGCITNADPVQ